jgi:hypothetical protein
MSAHEPSSIALVDIKANNSSVANGSSSTSTSTDGNGRIAPTSKINDEPTSPRRHHGDPPVSHRIVHGSAPDKNRHYPLNRVSNTK